MLLVLLALGAGGFGVWSGLRVGPAPQIVIEPGLPAIGPKTPITIRVTEPVRGLSTVVVELVQGSRVVELKKDSFMPQPAWKPWAGRTPETSYSVEVGRESNPELEPGMASIRVTAGIAGTWLQQPPPAQENLALPVRFTPPSISVSSTNIDVAQGGCEVVVYEVSETSVRDGVRAGKWFFPGYPRPKGRERERFALFAVPYDMDTDTDVKLVAADDVGNETAISFISSFKPRPYRKDTINVSTSALEKMVPKVIASTPGYRDRGSLLDNYVAINREMRGENDGHLVELAKQTKAEFAWDRPFLQMPGKVFSSFADRRTYVYEGKEIDQEFHLGFDIASTKHAEIPAANAGTVVFADNLGIYGSAIVVDHGYGLMSLYGHISRLLVKLGDSVSRGQPLGLTGETGLALGDHLHFTMLLHGLAVTPMEWWDAHWIHDRLVLKLEDSLPFEENEGS